MRSGRFVVYESLLGQGHQDASQGGGARGSGLQPLPCRVVSLTQRSRLMNAEVVINKKD